MTPLYIFASLYALWVLYLAVMSLLRAKRAGVISRPALILGYPVVAVGILLDVVLNATVCSILFLELPKEWTLSQRMKRHINTGSGWRESMAAWICSNLLNAFDPSGKHC